jgi:hypothetical protein
MTTFPIAQIRATLINGDVHLEWPDGTHVRGCAGPSNRSAGIAARHMGYPNAAAMVLEHDLTHAALEAWLGMPSAVMLRLRGLAPLDVVRENAEEEAVLALQRYMRVVGVDLVEVLKGTA